MIPSSIRALISNNTVQKIWVLASGTALAQLITAAFMPVISRIYSPSEIGILGIFNSSLSILLPAAAFCLPLATVIEPNEKRAASLINLSKKTTIATGALLLTILTLFGKDIVAAFVTPQSTIFSALLVTGLLSAASLQIGQQIAIRSNQFRKLGHTTVIQSLIQNLLKTSAGLILPTAAALMVSTIISQALQSFLLTRKQAVYSRKTTFKEELLTAKDYSDFCTFRSPQMAINASSQSLPIFLLATMFGPNVAGLYALTKSSIGIPTTLLGKSISDVFYPHFYQKHSSGESLYKLLLTATSLSFLVSIIPTIILIWYGPELFRIIFGSQWEKAGVYSQWASMILMTSLTCRPAIAAIPVLRIQRLFLLNEIVFLLLSFSGACGAYYFTKNDVVTVATYSVIASASYVWLLFSTIHHARKISTKEVQNDS